MERWGAIRAKAEGRRDEAGALGREDADELARAVAKLHRLRVAPFTPGREGYADDLRAYFAVHRIGVSDRLSREERAAELGHELGHVDLHDDRLIEDAPAPPARPDGSRPLSGYSPRQTKERQAWLYSDELICSSSDVRELLASGKRPSEIAAERGLTCEVVRRQSANALLRSGTGRPDPSRPPPSLNPEQVVCERWAGGALLVEGRAGTGKTTTLAARARFLLSRGVPATEAGEPARGVAPSSVLVLAQTPAAAEALERDVTASHPTALGKAWFCTFQDFAHEVVVRWPDRIGLELDFRLVGPRSARGGATPDGGCVIGAGTPGTGSRQVDSVRADDLLRLAVQILEKDPSVLDALRKLRANVLVDDVQNVAPDGLTLLRMLCPPGTALMATGDPSQRLDRHRGRTGEGLLRFEQLFGGERIRLSRQHRAVGPALAVARRVHGDGRRPPRSGRPTAVLTVARDVEGEALAIRDGIERLRRGGVAYGDQAVLARQHSTLDHLARALDRLGVPVLHLGDFHAREDVLDHVALLELAMDGGVDDLERVACRAPYHANPALVARVRGHRERGWSLARALATVADGPGGDGLALLASHLAETPRTSTHEALSHWAFERSGAAAELFADDGLGRRLNRVALHHLLVFCAERSEAGDRGTAGLRDALRRINSLDRHGRFREVDLGASGLDAVHMLTFPAGRGREFRAVHVAGLRKVRRKLTPDDDVAEAHLFRLAVTRARSHIAFYRALRYPGRDRDPPSPLLAALRGLLVEHRV